MFYNLKRIIALIMLISLSACGFKPILATNSTGYKALTEIKVVSVEGPDKLRLKRLVNEEFDNDLQSIPKYDLKISISYNSFPMGVMKDTQITRYRVTTNLNYILINAETQKTVDSGAISLNGSYDASNSDFSNYISERHVSDNLVKELSKELKGRLSLVMADLEAKGESRP